MLAEAVANQNLSLRKLSIISNVPYASVYDIAHNKIDMKDCKYSTIRKLADALNVPSDILVQSDTFRHFRDDLHRELKSKDVNAFMLYYIQHDTVTELFRAGYTTRAMYLMCMLDYLCRLLNMPVIKEYDFLRRQKLQNPVVISEYEDGEHEYIPEFKIHNILEGDIFDAV